MQNPKDGTTSDPTKKALAIAVIEGIIRKFNISRLTSPETIYSAIEQIIAFLKYVPPELREKAVEILKSLWKRKFVLFSTEKEKAEELTNIQIEDPRLLNLHGIIGPTEKSIILQSISIKRLNERGLHEYADNRKDEIVSRYHYFGEVICQMITTGDINIILDELDDKEKNEHKKRLFEWWVENYHNVSLMVSPLELKHPDKIKEKIIKMAASTTRNYLLIHLTATPTGCDSIDDIVSELKEERKLTYTDLITTNESSGFYNTITIRLIFSGNLDITK